MHWGKSEGWGIVHLGGARGKAALEGWSTLGMGVMWFGVRQQHSWDGEQELILNDPGSAGGEMVLKVNSEDKNQNGKVSSQGKIQN